MAKQDSRPPPPGVLGSYAASALTMRTPQPMLFPHLMWYPMPLLIPVARCSLPCPRPTFLSIARVYPLLLHVSHKQHHCITCESHRGSHRTSHLPHCLPCCDSSSQDYFRATVSLVVCHSPLPTIMSYPELHSYLPWWEVHFEERSRLSFQEQYLFLRRKQRVRRRK